MPIPRGFSSKTTVVYFFLEVIKVGSREQRFSKSVSPERATSTSPGNLSEMQISEPHPDLWNQGIKGLGDGGRENCIITSLRRGSGAS